MENGGVSFVKGVNLNFLLFTEKQKGEDGTRREMEINHRKGK